MPAPEIIHQLVQQFKENISEYKSARYNEAQLRHEFLDKFFEALGWDVYNMRGYSIDNRDVIVEDSLEIEGHSKSPDYAFKIGKERKFYVEAKKPHVNIKTDFEPAYQLRRYAWSNHLALSVLTDFEEFSLYDCRERPTPGVNPASARLLYVKFEEYPERWDEIASILSKEAVYKGSFDRYVLETKGKKGTTEVDDEFLKDIEEWRKKLALNIALRNSERDHAQPEQPAEVSPGPGLIRNERQLNYAVQMTIDRLIFLRICEDRGIEPEEQLLELSKKPNIYPSLVQLFRLADTKYNSGLFHFNQGSGESQSGSNTVDTFTPQLVIDDKVLKEIIRGLYYPCPYVFKEIPVEILGQVYEQFLGKVIRLTAGHQAKIEEKPEVRKAGGVYYTPKYIVDYIVANTVGKLLEGKTPEEACQLRIVDPACGSGSFLLGAFQYLLDWHEDWYAKNDPDKWAKGRNPALSITKDGWRLTTAEKKRILVNNIYGVDIDEQAVEVTKLSLLLKVLEEESGQLSLGLERRLPDLGNNIKCGNSLISWDYFTGQLIPDEKEVERVNPFDWEKQFPEVFAKGGFDAVIGNPPYIRIQAMQEWAPGEVEFYRTKYLSATKGNYDIYVVFIEKGLSLLNRNGLLGLILPHKFFTSKYGEPIRKLINAGIHLKSIIHFGDLQVFQNATTHTCLMFLQKTQVNETKVIRVNNIDSWRHGDKNATESCYISLSDCSEWTLLSENFSEINKKLLWNSIDLEKIAGKIFQGLVTGADSVFLLRNLGSGNYYSEAMNKTYQIEENLMHPLCKGSVNIRRFYISELEKSILFPYKIIENKAVLLTTDELSKNYPNCWKYLKENRTILENREHGKWKHNRWYALGRNQNLNEMEQKKILTPSIASHSSFMLDNNDYFYFVGSGGGGGGGYGITLKDGENISYEYLLGLLNSKLLDKYLKTYSSQFSGGYYAYNRQYIEKLPIHIIDFTNPSEVKQHDRMVALVEHMIELHKRTPQTPHEQESLARDIANTDAQIDQLVYQLYGLTDEEIRIVEGKE